MTSLEQLVWRCIWPSWNIDEQQSVLKKIELCPPGAVTLFRRHLEDLAGTLNLNRQIREKSDGKTLIAVDEEGGSVRRMPEPFPVFPPGAHWLKADVGPELIEESHAELGRLLSGFGFSIDFAPVCDLEFTSNHPALLDRCFSSEPQLCGDAVAAAVRGLQRGGVGACAKHFPGHGAVGTDSHVELDTLTRSREEVGIHEMVPFRSAVAAGVRLIMAAHFHWPALDTSAPTTFSRKLVELVRQELQFGGVLLTDDLEMGAIACGWPREEAAVLALSAGYDAVLYCKSFEIAETAAEICIKEAEKSASFRKMLEESRDRIEQVTSVDAAATGSLPDLDIAMQKAASTWASLQT